MACTCDAESLGIDDIAAMPTPCSSDHYDPAVHPDRISSYHGPDDADTDVPRRLTRSSSYRVSTTFDAVNSYHGPDDADTDVPRCLTRSSSYRGSTTFDGVSSNYDPNVAEDDVPRSGYGRSSTSSEQRRKRKSWQSSGWDKTGEYAVWEVSGGACPTPVEKERRRTSRTCRPSDGDIPDDQLTDDVRRSLYGESARTGSRSSAAHPSPVDSVAAELVDNVRYSYDQSQRVEPRSTASRAEREYASEAEYNSKSHSARPSVVWHDNHGADETKSVVSRVATVSSVSGNAQDVTDDEPSVYRPASGVRITDSEPSLPRPDSTVDEVDETSPRRSKSNVLP